MESLDAEANVHPGCLGFQQASHILDAEDVDTLVDELIDEVEVVLKSVFALLGARNVTAVAYDGLADTTSLLRGVDTELQLSARLVLSSVFSNVSYVLCEYLSANAEKRSEIKAHRCS